MWLSRIVPSAKTVLMRVVLNVKLTKLVRDNRAWCPGAHATTPIIHIALADGRVKRKTPVHSAKKPGQQSKLRNNDPHK